MKKIDSDFLENNRHLFNHNNCVFVVGAGISVPSGIPDFRSPTGIFASLKQQLKINGRNLFTYNFGIKEGSRQIYLKYISSLKRLCDNSTPNRTHHFLANFPRSRVYTQNIDGLEERAGMVFDKTDRTRGVYLHGNLSKLVCQYCGFKREFTESDLKSFENGDEIECIECLERNTKGVSNGLRRRPVGVMHPGIIHYQQVHPDGAFIGRICEKDLNTDLLIVIGTSLAVDGVKKLVKMFCRCENAQGKRILVNLTKPNKEWESYFDYFYEGDCEDFVKIIEQFKKIPRSDCKAIISNEIPSVSDQNSVNVADKIDNENDSRITDQNVAGEIDNDISSIVDETVISNENDSRIAGEIDSRIADTTVIGDKTDTTVIADEIDSRIADTTVIGDKNNTAGKVEVLIELVSPSEHSKSSIEDKMHELSKSFVDEESLNKSILEEALKDAKNTEIHTSFCADLQEEIESIVSRTFEE